MKCCASCKRGIGARLARSIDSRRLVAAAASRCAKVRRLALLSIARQLGLTSPAHGRRVRRLRGGRGWTRRSGPRAARGNAALWDAIGTLHSFALDQRGALAAYDRAVALAPHNPRFLYNRASVRRFLGILPAPRPITIGPSR